MKKSVTVRIRGGLGNQLFCYAIGFYLAKQNNLDFIIDGDTGFIGDKFGREYSLHRFGHKKNKIKKIYWLFSRFLVIRLLVKIFYLTFKIPHKKRIFWVENWGAFRSNGIKLNGNLYLDGYWQKADYLFEFRDCLRNSLMKNLRKESQVRLKPNSVAVHFRGSEVNFILDEDYYLAAVTKMRSKIKDPHFYLFSDVNFENISSAFIEGEYTIVPKGGDDGFDNFILMCQCENFIIANSTFSWWASFLSENDQKIIFLPKEIEKNLIPIQEDAYFLV
jgi:hypothetical protein